MSEKTCKGCSQEGQCSQDPSSCGMAKKGKGRIGHIVAVGSGKGGVGKSSLTSLLAIGLAKQGKKVGVLDADVTGPSIPKLLGVRSTPMGTPDGIIPSQSPQLNIRVMSVNLILDDPAKPVVWRGPLIGNVLKQFWEDVNWGELDVLLVDLPPGTADAPLTVMQVMPLDGLVMVTSPQGLAGLIVEKACNMANMMNVDLLGLVQNMSYAVCPDCGQKIEIFGPSHAAEVSERFNVPLLAELPIDTRVAILGDAGRLEEYDEAAILDPLVNGLLARLEAKAEVAVEE